METKTNGTEAPPPFLVLIPLPLTGMETLLVFPQLFLQLLKVLIPLPLTGMETLTLYYVQFLVEQVLIPLPLTGMETVFIITLNLNDNWF